MFKFLDKIAHNNDILACTRIGELIQVADVMMYGAYTLKIIIIALGLMYCLNNTS